jgi:uncharacterized protein YndB with AHSA1/START domain
MLSRLFVIGFLFPPSLAFSKGKDSEDNLNHQTFTVSAKLPVDGTVAFRFFTEKEFLERWLTTAANVEPKLGGKYELFWNPDTPDDNSTKGCHITAIEQGRILAFDWKGPVQFKEFMNNADPLTHVTVSFSPCEKTSEPCTTVHLLHSGWRNSQNWNEAKAWQERAWRGAFEELKALASSL